MSNNYLEDIKSLQASLKAVLKRIDTAEYVAEAAHERADGLQECLKALCKRVGATANGADLFDCVLVGAGGKLRPLHTSESIEETLGLWKATYDISDEETKNLILRKINALAELRNQRAWRVAQKLAKAKAKQQAKIVGVLGIRDAK